MMFPICDDDARTFLIFHLHFSFLIPHFSFELPFPRVFQSDGLVEHEVVRC